MNRQQQRMSKYDHKAEIRRIGRMLLDFAMVTEDTLIAQKTKRILAKASIPGASAKAIKNELHEYFVAVGGDVALLEQESGVRDIEQLAKLYKV